MDYLLGLEKAKSLGVSKEEFQKHWEEEIALKRSTVEVKLLELKRQPMNQRFMEEVKMFELDQNRQPMKHLETKSSQLSKEVLADIIAKIDNLSQELKEELLMSSRKQTQEISQLRQNFATLVGAAVRKEIDCSLTEAGFGQRKCGDSDLTRSNPCNRNFTTNEKPVGEICEPGKPMSYSVDVGMAKKDCERVLIDDSGSVGSNCIEGSCSSLNICTRSEYIDSVGFESNDQQTLNEKANVMRKTESLLGVRSSLSHADSTNSLCSTDSQRDISLKPASWPSWKKGKRDGFFSFCLEDITQIVSSKRRVQSLVANVGVCVRLKIWFDDGRLCVIVSFFKGKDEKKKLQCSDVVRVFGSIQNSGSGCFSPLFEATSKKVGLIHKKNYHQVEASVALETSKRKHEASFDILKEKNYILTPGDVVFIRWRVEVVSDSGAD